MSATSYKLPSRPERTLRGPPESHVADSTGVEPATYTNSKDLKRRIRSEIMQKNVPEPTEKKTQNALLNYFENEAERKEDASCVFLLWGSRDSERFPTWAVDVQTTGIENEEIIFQKLAQRFSTERGFLRRAFSLREFDKLEPVTFRMISRSSGRFLIFMEPFDSAKYRTEYSERQEEADAEIKTIADFDSDPAPDFCFRNRAGKYEHDNVRCPFSSVSWGGLAESMCPFEKWDAYHDRIRWIDTAKFLSCYFRNPTGACHQRILDGIDGHRFIHNYSDIRHLPDSFRPQNRYLSVHGLYLSTRLNAIRGICVLSGLTMLVTLGGKLVWNSWEIVFGAGSFFVAIPMLAMAAITYSDA